MSVLAVLALLGLSFGVGSMATAAPVASAAAPRVLHVDTWNGHVGEFTTITDAVAAAQPGDWVLVGPGDYHEGADHGAANPTEAGGAVTITTPGVHLRGMDRAGVVVDGTKAGAAPCSSNPADQDLGPLGPSATPLGRNGIVALEADGVSIDNLTACNFLSGSAGGGNQIWWNGGDGSGTQNLAAYEGSYLSATSTYFEDGKPAGEYGLFASNVTGPGTWTHTYASNMADSSYYVGACPDCNTLIDDAHAQGSALGYSGTNSGGRLIVQNSEFDNNKTGFSTNSQNNDDAPSPQDGICPASVPLGPTGTRSCWVFRNNDVHDNNNADTPGSGSAELGPPGAGLVISGGRHDIVTGNRFTNNGSWAVLLVPFIDSGPPPPVAHCEGGIKGLPAFGPDSCFFVAWGNEISGNTFSGNGAFGNVTNGDLGDLGTLHNPDGNCYHGNTDTAGAVTSAPADLQVTNATCGAKGNTAALLTSDLSKQVVCATEVFGPCPDQPGFHYPRRQHVQLLPLPAQQTMPDPCLGVPDDPWCPAAVVTTTVTSPPTTPPVAPPTSAPPAVAPVAVGTSPRFTG